MNLTETDTFTLVDFPSLNVSNEATEEVNAIKTANARYKEVCIYNFFLKIESHTIKMVVKSFKAE